MEPMAQAPQATPADMPDDEILYELADLFRVFGDSTRIKILYALHDQELCVQDIAAQVGLSQSAVSHQLRVLKDSKLVRFRRDGKCANKMEAAAQKTPGVKNATVNFMTLKMNVEFEEGQNHKAVMQQVYANCKKVEDDCEIFGI